MRFLRARSDSACQSEIALFFLRTAGSAIVSRIKAVAIMNPRLIGRMKNTDGSP
jgi:hypothetical protein